jgi:hypothetical protein
MLLHICEIRMQDYRFVLLYLILLYITILYTVGHATSREVAGSNLNEVI